MCERLETLRSPRQIASIVANDSIYRLSWRTSAGHCGSVNAATHQATETSRYTRAGSRDLVVKTGRIGALLEDVYGVGDRSDLFEKSFDGNCCQREIGRRGSAQSESPNGLDLAGPGGREFLGRLENPIEHWK
jgi:hypothetical protein